MRALLSLALIVCCAAFVRADDAPKTVELAKARAEACVAIAKANAQKLAEVKADAAIKAAKLAPPCKCPPEACEGCDCPGPNCPAPATSKTAPAVLSADGQTLRHNGKTYRRLPNGTFAETNYSTQSNSSTCVNGQCPNAR